MIELAPAGAQRRTLTARALTGAALSLTALFASGVAHAEPPANLPPAAPTATTTAPIPPPSGSGAAAPIAPPADSPEPAAPAGAPPGGGPQPGYPPGTGQPPYGYPPGYGPPPGYPPGYGHPPGYAPYPYPYPYPYPHSLPRPAPRPPALLPYEEGKEIPAGYHLEIRANRKLIAAGAGVLGGAWLFSVAVTSLVLSNSGGDDHGYAPLFVPVVGPLIALGTSDLDFDRDSGIALFLVLDGIAQIGGAALLVTGLLKDKKVLLRDRDPPALATATGMLPDVEIGLGRAHLVWRY